MPPPAVPDSLDPAAPTSLRQLRPGEHGCIAPLPDVGLDNGAASDDALSLLRLGLFPGETVEVVAHLPAGPTVVRQQHMELALGQQLAERILVQRVAS